MRRILLAVCAVLALAVIGAALPRGRGRTDAATLRRSQAPVVHQAPWPAWAHSSPPTASAAPNTPNVPVPAMAAPVFPEKQAAGEHARLLSDVQLPAVPASYVQLLNLDAAPIYGRALPVLSPPPRSF